MALSRCKALVLPLSLSLNLAFILYLNLKESVDLSSSFAATNVDILPFLPHGNATTTNVEHPTNEVEGEGGEPKVAGGGGGGGRRNNTAVNIIVSERVLAVPDRHKQIKPLAFDPWPNPSLPCFHPTDNDTSLDWLDRQTIQARPTTNGLVFLKLLKVGSSTGAGVHIRMARNLARRQKQSFSVCKCRFMHMRAKGLLKDFKNKEPDAIRQQSSLFLWTILRGPQARYLSEFFHIENSRLKHKATDANIIKFLQGGRSSDHHYLSWLSFRLFRRRQVGKLFAAANRILQSYHFIGITERMDESLVALSMLTHGRLADILYLPQKFSGGWDDGQWHKTCFQIQPTFVSDGVQAFLNSSMWKGYIQVEERLYQAANASLDLTIERLGRNVFDAKLRRFQQAQTVVQERCSHVKLPCSSTGVRREDTETDCILGDYGCGFDCLDQVATSLDLW